MREAWEMHSFDTFRKQVSLASHPSTKMILALASQQAFPCSYQNIHLFFFHKHLWCARHCSDLQILPQEVTRSLKHNHPPQKPAMFPTASQTRNKLLIKCLKHNNASEACLQNIKFINVSKRFNVSTSQNLLPYQLFLSALGKYTLLLFLSSFPPLISMLSHMLTFPQTLWN